MNPAWLYCWATSLPRHGMPDVSDLERDGWERIGEDERYGSILMRKACEDMGKGSP